MTPEPLVSVVLPCYDGAATLARALASVRRQSYRALDIIAIDDCSSDATLTLLRREEGPDLRVIARAVNGGPAAARNDGLAAARGEFVAFIDQDDEWRPDKIRRQIDIIAARPEMVLIGCRAEEQFVDGHCELVNAGRQPPVGREAWRTMLRHGYYAPSVILARTDTARRIGGFDASLRCGEDDQDFCIRMALAGEVGFVDEVLTIMQNLPSNFSVRVAGRDHETILPVVLRHCAALRDRLSRRERRAILAARYTQAGRNVYRVHPATGAWLLLRAIAYGGEPAGNLWYLLTASSWAGWLKRQWRRGAATP